MNYKDLRTLTGMTLQEALSKLQAPLEAAAYKKVTGGGAPLTDIKPAWLTEALTEVFGLCGVGWSFDWDTIEIYSTDTITKSGAARLVWQADIMKGRLIYTLTDGTDNFKFDVPGTGGSDNDVKEYAVRGAVTNMIGAAASKLLWQLPVYKGQADEIKPEQGDRQPARPQAGKPVPPKADDNRPWYAKAIEFAGKDATIWDAPLGKSQVGQRAITVLKEQVGAGKWFMAAPHIANAIKKYTGFKTAEEMTWPDFQKLCRVYAGPACIAGETIKDVLFYEHMKAADWQTLLHLLGLTEDFELDEMMATALDNALVTARTTKVKDGKMDVDSIASDLRKHFVKNADSVGESGEVDMGALPEVSY